MKKQNGQKLSGNLYTSNCFKAPLYSFTCRVVDKQRKRVDRQIKVQFLNEFLTYNKALKALHKKMKQRLDAAKKRNEKIPPWFM